MCCDVNVGHFHTGAPTLVVGRYVDFLQYRRAHPHARLVHVGRLDDVDGWEAAAVVTVGPWTPEQQQIADAARGRLR